MTSTTDGTGSRTPRDVIGNWWVHAVAAGLIAFGVLILVLD
ncbi:MAG: hypothetical protein ABW219_18005 [Ilumatobacteraceae bacterium]